MLPTRWNPQLFALLPLRLAMGAGFLLHGIAKFNRGPENFAKLLALIGSPFPLPTAWLVTLLEIFGGIALILGAFTAVATIPLIFSMLVAMFTIHIHYGFSSINTIGLSPNGPLFGPPGYEINLLYIAGLTALLLQGPGTLSFDHWLHRKKHPAQENPPAHATAY